MTYILRHTQLLPRQLIAILERLIIASHMRTGGYRELKSDLVVAAVEQNESVVATEIFSAYKHVFPSAEKIGRSMFGNYPTVFSYDELEDKWRKSGRPLEYGTTHSAPEFVDFTDMMLRIGVVGVVSEETEIYVEGKFSYSQLIPPNIGQGNKLCIHPIFSRHFKCRPNNLGKAVLPFGVILS